jgi:hypothetical protein
MKRNTGNQYISVKRRLLNIIAMSRAFLTEGDVVLARCELEYYRTQYAKVPASTRRRWKCGK